MLRQSSQNSLCTALLYSKKAPHERQIVAETIDKIQNDPTLSQSIQLICTDNIYCQSLMNHNQAGIQVPKSAVFLMKHPGKTTQIIPISSREDVFDQFIRNSPRPLRTDGTGPEPIIGKRIPWILNKFPEDGSGRTIKVKVGDRLDFNSTDGLVHDVTEANPKWEPLRRLIPRQPNLSKMLEITPDFRPTTYLICSVGSNSDTMRLKVIKDGTISRDRTGDIIDGILNYRDSKGDKSSKDVSSSTSEPKYRITKVTIKSKPQIVEMEDGTKVRVVSKPTVIMPDDSSSDQ